MSRPLESELTDLLNEHSVENASNTPDFVLARYLLGCLASFEAATKAREDWYGHRHEPGSAP